MVEIKEKAEKPVFFKNHAYKRVGTTNQRISSSELRHLVKESSGKGSISNKEYISLNNVSRKTATTDLKRLVLDGLVIRIGEGKRKLQYIIPDYAKITQKITQKEVDTF